MRDVSRDRNPGDARPVSRPTAGAQPVSNEIDNLLALAQVKINTSPNAPPSEVLNNLAEELQAGRVACYALEGLACGYATSNPLNQIGQINLAVLIPSLTKQAPPTDPALQNAHQSFLNSDVAVQVQFLSRQLPTEDASYKQITKILFASLLKDFLPPTDLNLNPQPNQKLNATQVGFLMIDPLLEVAPRELQVRCIAGLLHSIRKAEELPATMSNDEKWGYRLGYFLNFMGSGFQKMCQHAHSLPITPREWLPGLESSKTDAGHMPRWTVWHEIEDSDPEIVDDIVLEKRLGTGAYQTTYGAKLSDDLKARILQDREQDREGESTNPIQFAVKALKKYAFNNSEEATRVVSNICDEIEKKFSNLPNTYASLQPIRKLLAHGRRMLEVETNPSLGKSQERIANEGYAAFCPVIDGEPFQARVTSIFRQKGSVQIVERVLGQQLNVVSSLNNSRTPTYAAAMLVYQLMIKLSGRCADHDVHGDNFCVGPGLIHHHDYAGLELAQPTRKSLVLTAHLMVNVVLNSIRNRYSIGSSLKHMMPLMEEHGMLDGKIEAADFQFIDSSYRWFLSLGDMIRCLTKEDSKNLRAALRAVVQSGIIDDALVTTTLKRFFAAGLLYASEKVPFGAILGRSPWVEEERFFREKYYPDNPRPRNSKLKSDSASKEPVNGAKLKGKASFSPLDIKVVINQDKPPLWKRSMFYILGRFI